MSEIGANHFTSSNAFGFLMEKSFPTNFLSLEILIMKFVSFFMHRTVLCNYVLLFPFCESIQRRLYSLQTLVFDWVPTIPVGRVRRSVGWLVGWSALLCTFRLSSLCDFLSASLPLPYDQNQSPCPRTRAFIDIDGAMWRVSASAEPKLRACYIIIAIG